MARVFSALSLIAVSQAQNWGSTGSWELVNPSPLANGAINTPDIAFHHASFVPGSFIVPGLDVNPKVPFPSGQTNASSLYMVSAL